jgi:hypothetical protein
LWDKASGWIAHFAGTETKSLKIKDLAQPVEVHATAAQQVRDIRPLSPKWG